MTKDDFIDEDPVEELHRIREAIWKKAGGTPEAYAQYYYEIGQKRLAREAAEKKAAALKTGKRRQRLAASCGA